MLLLEVVAGEDRPLGPLSSWPKSPLRHIQCKCLSCPHPNLQDHPLYYRDLLSRLASAAFAVDQDGRITHWNSFMANLTQVRPFHAQTEKSTVRGFGENLTAAVGLPYNQVPLAAALNQRLQDCPAFTRAAADSFLSEPRAPSRPSCGAGRELGREQPVVHVRMQVGAHLCRLRRLVASPSVESCMMRDAGSRWGVSVSATETPACPPPPSSSLFSVSCLFIRHPLISLTPAL